MTKKQILDLAETIHASNNWDKRNLVFSDIAIRELRLFCQRWNPNFNEEKWNQCIEGKICSGLWVADHDEKVSM